MSIVNYNVEKRKNNQIEELNEIIDEVRKCQKRMKNIEDYIIEFQNIIIREDKTL